MFCRKDPRKILILANRSLVGVRGGRGSSPAGFGGAGRRRRGERAREKEGLEAHLLEGLSGARDGRRARVGEE